MSVQVRPTASSHLIIAIDGPAGAGKSTLAARLAARFDLLNLETGAMYRAFALKALQVGASPDDASQLEPLLSTTGIVLQPAAEGNRVLLDGEDVTARLREKEITAAASRVSVHPAVRRWLVGLQREMGENVNGEKRGAVMEGRDIGTAVFPNAQVKIFLDASPEKRSERRYSQTVEAAPDAAETSRAVLKEMHERDERDRNRADSPLRPATDAIIIDSTELSLDEVIAKAEAIVIERLASPGQ
jgi:cytidylate kinase